MLPVAGSIQVTVRENGSLPEVKHIMEQGNVTLNKLFFIMIRHSKSSVKYSERLLSTTLAKPAKSTFFTRPDRVQ